MKKCPYCSEVVDANHLFCRSCGASLRLPEYDRAFCPHCGARVSAKQEFCHECHWHLVAGEAGPVPARQPLSERILQQLSRRPAVSALAATLGAVLLLLMGWLVFSVGGPIFSPQPPEFKAAPSPSPPASPAKLLPIAPTAPAPEPEPWGPQEAKNRLKAVLDDIKAAQLSRDIDHFMQAYTEDFPDREEKREKILQTWQFFDFSKMNYTIEELDLVDAENIMAQVSWEIETTGKGAEQAETSRQTFHVRLSKVDDNWRISKVERVEVQ